MHQIRRHTKAGFTLIELLVVIAIIALLIGILLPALGRARNAGRQAISLSNIRQITTAAMVYREDFKGFLPMVLSYTPRGSVQMQGNSLAGACTWAFGGKNTNAFWAGAYGGAFDIEAADRPLNPYLYPDLTPDAPAGMVALPPQDPARKALEMFVYRDPSDQATHQRNWPEPDFRQTSYNDVGTSYHTNFKWFEELRNRLGFAPGWNFGCLRFKVADAFQPSRMVWIGDETMDLVTNNSFAAYQYRNGYGDINKAVLGFMDGSGRYVTMIPGNLPQSFANDSYTLVFPDLRLP
ncbi:MAG: prepilin-type N-terminal cleavage/methylation domain-containing protein [Phycisphaerae bacterium]|nr:prepilin-type N-terminal cleavage/methylation domain-containing protein [Phycisphaerae bacterium]